MPRIWVVVLGVIAVGAAVWWVSVSAGTGAGGSSASPFPNATLPPNPNGGAGLGLGLQPSMSYAFYQKVQAEEMTGYE